MNSIHVLEDRILQAANMEYEDKMENHVIIENK